MVPVVFWLSASGNETLAMARRFRGAIESLYIATAPGGSC
jgi:hypothetical protein